MGAIAFSHKHIRAASWQNQQNGMYSQRRLRSAWASAQSDQSLRCQHEGTLGPNFPLSAQWRLTRLGGCPGWSESLLGSHVILLVLSCCSSYWKGCLIPLLFCCVKCIIMIIIWTKQILRSLQDRSFFLLLLIKNKKPFYNSHVMRLWHFSSSIS